MSAGTAMRIKALEERIDALETRIKVLEDKRGPGRPRKEYNGEKECPSLSQT